jgi:hypothetical protein
MVYDATVLAVLLVSAFAIAVAAIVLSDARLTDVLTLGARIAAA